MTLIFGFSVSILTLTIHICDDLKSHCSSYSSGYNQIKSRNIEIRNAVKLSKEVKEFTDFEESIHIKNSSLST